MTGTNLLRYPLPRQWRAGVVQGVAPDGMYDLGPGYLDPELLPVDLIGEAYRAALAEFGPAALSYGHNSGAVPLRAALAAEATRRGRHRYAPENFVVTAGTSQALHLLATSLARPGDVVVLDALSYDLGRRIFLDCGLRVLGVPADAAGMDPEALRGTLRDLRAADRRPAFVYLNPTFHNPTGLVVPAARRTELLDVARAHGVLILEDDAYADLDLADGAVPRSLSDLAGTRGVVRLGTFSKTLGPGLRLGWLAAEPALAARIATHGLLVSGGCLNHTTSLAVSTVLASGAYTEHLRGLRHQLRARRDALVGALRSGGIDVVTPAGGYFLWLRFPGDRTEAELLDAARRARVCVSAGSRFGPTPSPALRLAYSFNAPDRLATAGRRLVVALGER